MHLPGRTFKQKLWRLNWTLSLSPSDLLGYFFSCQFLPSSGRCLSSSPSVKLSWNFSFREQSFSWKPLSFKMINAIFMLFPAEKSEVSSGAVSRTRDFPPTKHSVLKFPYWGYLKTPFFLPHSLYGRMDAHTTQWPHHHIWRWNQTFTHGAPLFRLARWCFAIITNSYCLDVNLGLMNMMNSHLMTSLCSQTVTVVIIWHYR